MMYKEGKGVTQNFERAFLWFKLAAKQGDAEAQFRLGLMYFEGQGVTQNYEKAVDLFKQAAEQGHTQAQSILANM